MTKKNKLSFLATPLCADLFATAFLIACYAVLRKIQSNYFFQDDNISQYVPILLRACRAVWWEGRMADWLPEQLFGIPVSAIPTYAVTSPFVHLSWLISRYLLLNETYLADVYFLLHAVPGLWVMSKLLRKLEVRPYLAATASLSFVLCGFHLIAGRSWFWVLPWILWTPLIFLFLLETHTFFNRKDVLKIGVALGIAFHDGNIQFWSYLVGFGMLFGTGLFFLNKNKKERKARLLNHLFGFLVALVIALPLLWVQASTLRGLVRIRPENDYGILWGFLGLFLPYPLVQFSSSDFPGLFEKISEVYYAGTVFLLVTFIALVASALPKFRKSKPALLFIFLGMFVLAFWLACGDVAGLWKLLSYLPVLSGFKKPIKLTHFVHFFSAISGAIVLESWLAKRKKGFEIALCTVALVLIGYHVTQADAAFYRFGFNSYLLPPREVAFELQNSSRFATYAPQRDPSRQYVGSLMHNLPSVFHAIAKGGYDPIVEGLPYYRDLKKLEEANREEFDKEYAVTHYLFTLEGREKLGQYDFQWLVKKGHRVYGDSAFELWRNDQAKPFGMSRAVASQPLPVKVGANQVELLDLTGIHKQLSVAFAWQPNFWANVDGTWKRAEKDDWGRLSITVNGPVSHVIFRYYAPWTQGFLAALFLALVTGGLYFLTERSQAKPRRNHA